MDSFGKTIEELRREDAARTIQKIVDEMNLNKVRIEEIVETNRELRDRVVEIYKKNFKEDY